MIPRSEGDAVDHGKGYLGNISRSLMIELLYLHPGPHFISQPETLNLALIA
jgi:hypothetical protein